jgi:mannitol-1-phosphate 5-dehydrogenase
MNVKKIIIFGAGKIGRSFIGQVFSHSGYEVVFVDINRKLIALLNQHQQYKIVIKDGENDRTLMVRRVRGICLDDTAQVLAELTDTGIVSLSVGQQGLQAAIPILAQALVSRGQKPLDVIIAENMRNADLFIREELRKRLPGDDLLQWVGLIETSIGKMVPIMTQKDIEDDPLQVFAEPYNSLIVAKNSFRNPLPDVAFLAPKENIKAWVDRKLFIHNLGHATAAYLGFQAYPEAVYIYEVLNDRRIFEATRQTMLQAADILMALYPDEFSPSQLEDHIDDLLHRFMNKSLGDTLFRVGCDLYRKLGPQDRLAAPVQAAIRTGKPYHLILEAVHAGISFRAKDENGNYLPSDTAFFDEAQKGSRYILKNVCGIC